MVDVPICYFVFSLRQRNKHFTLFLRPFFMPQASNKQPCYHGNKSAATFKKGIFVHPPECLTACKIGRGFENFHFPRCLVLTETCSLIMQLLTYKSRKYLFLFWPHRFCFDGVFLLFSHSLITKISNPLALQIFLQPLFFSPKCFARSELLTKVLHETSHLLNPCHYETMISSIPTPSNVLLLLRSSSCAPFRTIVVNMPLRQKIENVAEKKLASTWIMLAELKLNMNIQNFDRLLDNLTCNTFNFRQLVCFQVYVLVKKNLSLHSVR